MGWSLDTPAAFTLVHGFRLRQGEMWVWEIEFPSLCVLPSDPLMNNEYTSKLILSEHPVLHFGSLGIPVRVPADECRSRASQEK